MIGSSHKDILVIEDDETYLEFIETILADEGYRLDTANDGREGLKAVREKQYDLVITDMFMPEVDGVQVLRELRIKRQSNVKIIAMSAGGRGITAEDTLPIARVLGANRTIHKPFYKDEFVPVIKELIG